jgi:hypothetical protein
MHGGVQPPWSFSLSFVRIYLETTWTLELGQGTSLVLLLLPRIHNHQGDQELNLFIKKHQDLLHRV